MNARTVEFEAAAPPSGAANGLQSSAHLCFINDGQADAYLEIVNCHRICTHSRLSAIERARSFSRDLPTARFWPVAA
jgi:hypothetical protein